MPTLNWIGKEAVVNHHHKVPFHLLKDVPELSVGDPGSGNLIVEGDNLVALKALLPYYAKQVKCIYIDPPYNTGEENWKYNDNVNSPIIRDWLGRVVGDEATDLSRHDKWLCMMYPRLQLLWQFLRDDGAIFVSIDDNEVSSMRILLDDIFQKPNFVASIIWQKRTSPDARLAIGPAHDYVLMYAKTDREAEAVVKEVAAIAETFGAGKPRPATGYEKQESFVVPLLSLRQGTLLWEFGKTDLLERDWKLSEKDATLTETVYSSKRPTGKLGAIDVDNTGKVIAGEVHETGPEDFVGKLHQQVWAVASEQNWTDEDLIQWLDQHIEHGDITAAESAVFLRKAIQGLMTSRGLPDISVLVLDRHRLRDAVALKIDAYREAEHQAAFKELLSAGLVVSEEKALDFSKIIYDPSSWYEGGFEFKKHYFGKPGELKSSGEEFECAQFLDGLSEVKYWIRNLAKRPDSFRLQTSTDYFYPDFVCLLQDGRRLVVEYKGKDRWDGIDATEKRDVGTVWEGRSNGKCLFVMPEGKDLGAIHRKIGS